MPPSNFDSFDQSPLGGLIESALGVRGGADLAPPVSALDGVYVTQSRYVSSFVYRHGVYRNSTFVGASNSQQCTYSFWVRIDGASFTYFRFGNSRRVYVFYNASSKSVSSSVSHNNGVILLSGAISNVEIGDYVHILASIDTDSSNGNTSYLYMNGVQVDSASLDYAAATLPAPFYLDNNTPIGLSDIYVNDTQYVDLSIPANLANFISGGAPVDLASFSPILYLSGDYNEWFDNKGSGGDVDSFGAFHNLTDDKFVMKGCGVYRAEGLTVSGSNNPRDCSGATIYTSGDSVDNLTVTAPATSDLEGYTDFTIKSQTTAEEYHLPLIQCADLTYFVDRGGFVARQVLNYELLNIYTQSTLPAGFANGDTVDAFEA